MKKRNFVALCLGLLWTLGSFADEQTNPPLRVAVNPFLPPFVMQTNNNEFFGFDIGLMNYLCKSLQRECKYMPMSIDQIFSAVHVHHRHP